MAPIRARSHPAEPSPDAASEVCYLRTMTRYFAYGANMTRAALRQRCADARVHGVLWRPTPRCLAALHAYELLHKGLYRVRRLPVRVGSRHLPAMVSLERWAISCFAGARAVDVGEAA